MRALDDLKSEDQRFSPMGYRWVQDPNGFMELTRLGRTFVVTGGPYAVKPLGLYGVNLREQKVGTEDVWLPIRDFSVPRKDQTREALKATIRLMLAGHMVYVGCQGGFGRTGLFLALLAKVFGRRDPIQYVRKHYHRKAVETKEQERFVRSFDVRRLRVWLLWQLLTNR